MDICSGIGAVPKSSSASGLPPYLERIVVNSLVSIVMPSFNSSRHIRQSIESVLAQTFQDFELLVVDGGSRDQTNRIVHEYSRKDARVRLIENANDQGPAHARSVGIRSAKGRFVAFLDADDCWLPMKLDAQLSFMRSTGCQFCFTRYRIMSEDGGKVGCIIPMRPQYDYATMLGHRGIGTLTVMLDIDLLGNDILNTWLRAGGEELMWWLMILREGRTAYLLDADLARYRNTGGSLSKNLPYTLKTVWGMYTKRLSLGVFEASWYFVSYVMDSIVRRMRLKVCAAMSGILNSRITN